MNWRVALVLVLVAGAALSAWSVWTHRTGNVVEGAARARSDYVLHDYELVVLGDDGSESFTLRGPRLARQPGKRSLALQTPLFLVPDADQRYWEVRSKRGWVSPDGDELRLRGAVRVDGPEDGRKITMNTEQLNVFPRRKLATSAAAVTITEPGLTMHGRGLRAELAGRRFTLLSQAKARYAPTHR